MRPVLTTVLAAALLTACSSSASPSSSAPASPGESGETPAPTPLATTAGEYPTLITDLGLDAAPIDVIAAFGSVWVANHHSDDVVRVDPATGVEQARITFTDGTGPAWLVFGDDGVWVTRQNNFGIARIDPATNELDPDQAGGLPPCGPPAIGLGAVWYWACDQDEMVRIELESLKASTISAPDMSTPTVVDDVLYAVGPDGLVRLADDGETWNLVGSGGAGGRVLSYAGGTLWVSNGDVVWRIDIASGAVVATIEISGAGVMSADAETAWITHEGPGPIERVQLSDNAVEEPLPASEQPAAVRVDGSTLWITDFGTSELWRVEVDE